MAASSSQGGGGELILAAPHGRPITAYDALTGDVVAEFPAANTPRHGLAAATGPGTAFVAASHVCPATGAGSIRLLQWWSPAPARELPVPEPVAAPYGSHLLAGGGSGCVHALALPSGAVASSFRAHGAGAVSCLALNDDGSLLVSGGDDGGVAVFPLIRVLDVDDASGASPAADPAIYRVDAYVAPVTSVVCGRGGCNAVVASASADGTCKVWRLADGAHLRTLALPCAALSLALDPTSSSLYAGCSDGRFHVVSLNSPGTNALTATTSHASDDSASAAALVAVSLANGCRNLVSCSEDGEVRVWDLTRGLLLANAFWASGAVGGVLVVRRVPGELARGGGERFRLRDGVAWTRTRELAEMGRLLRAEEETATSVELIEMNAGVYRRCLRLLLREVTTVANGGRRGGVKDGNASD
ncbi:hypothetical protein PAHAL_2G303600 [Panicum hallii]|jgi:pre-rRNA-processing protein IPI3|uniref:Uncharacterized protein n=1 Tax=Panicum hallii TaxID=206008 RepID=A0A2S3H0I2_9POAL|nr:protein ROOT INITIATION DEFECTIVE 3-like [Panicum hallii]PAN12954.1 hypothetical protein PAHAL_2G303600 [Panicum hallii]